ncbi:MAG: redox-regulated ATPase YchF [Planctomycetota bacterium]|nr:MAG: redox-regulated ATPase YchF [Planctomycetota bacterium]
MKIGIVGFQGSGKSSLFQLMTGLEPDPAKVQSGQVGSAIVPDERFRRLVELYRPRKQTPARIELFDTPGLDRSAQARNAQRLGIIRESAALVQVVGQFAGVDPLADVQAFQEELVLADLQIVTRRIERLEKDVSKPRPDREQLAKELEALKPLAELLESGRTLQDIPFTEDQQAATRSFSLLTRKQRLIVLNTSDSAGKPQAVQDIEALGLPVVCGPIGLELELQRLPDEEREEFAEAMGVTESCRERVLRAIFEITDLITFYTCDEKEVRAWLIKRGSTALEAADTIHSDLARGFIRAEVMSVDDLLRLGSEREVKAAGLQHVEGRDYIVQDGDEIVVRFNV